jgi:hypothetical protein
VFSSARDLAVLLAANLGDIPVEPGLAAAIQLAQKPVFRFAPQNQQALAWEVNDYGGPTRPSSTSPAASTTPRPISA